MVCSPWLALLQLPLIMVVVYSVVLSVPIFLLLSLPMVLPVLRRVRLSIWSQALLLDGRQPALLRHGLERCSPGAVLLRGKPQKLSLIHARMLTGAQFAVHFVLLHALITHAVL